MGFMNILLILLLIVYIPACILLILVVLAQEGKGGGISGLLSGGSALGDTLGASAGESFYRKWTRNIAVVFMLFTVLLTLVLAKIMKSGGSTAFDSLSDPPVNTAPAITDPSADPTGAGLAAEIGDTNDASETTTDADQVSTETGN